MLITNLVLFLSHEEILMAQKSTSSIPEKVALNIGGARAHRKAGLCFLLYQPKISSHQHSLVLILLLTKILI